MNNKYFPFLAVFIWGVILYLPTVRYEFALDDKISIINNQFTKKGIAGIPDIITHDYFYGFFGEEKHLLTGGRYRPLSLIVFAVIWEFFQDNPMPYHLLNVLLYGVTGIFMFMLLKTIFREITGNGPFYLSLPFLATILYLSHPLHVEVVANIKSLDEILSFLLAIIGHLRVWNGDLVGGGIAFFLSLTAKESSVTYIPAIGASYFLFVKRDLKGTLKIMLAPGIAFMVYVVLRLALLGMPTIEPVKELLNDPYLGATSEQKFATIAYVMLLYLKLLFFPHPLTHDYYPFYIKWTKWSNPLSLLSLVIHGMMLGYMIKGLLQKAADRVITYVLVIYIFGMSIYTNILFSVGSFMNERFVYVASVGYAIFIPYLLFYKSKRIALLQKLGRWIFILMVAGYTIKTYARSPAWYNDESLALTDVEISVGSAKVNMSAGLSSLKIGRKVKDTVECCKAYRRMHVSCPKVVYRGDTIQCCELLKEDTVRCPEILREDSLWRRKWFIAARNYAMRSLAIYPTYSHAMVVAGNAYFELNNLDSAIFWFIRCLEVNPTFNDCINNLSVCADKAKDIGKYALADRAYTMLLKVKKNDATLYAKAGEVAGRFLGDIPRAYSLIKKGLALDSTNTDLMTKMGVVYGLLGKYDSALFFFKKILKQFPKDARTLLNVGVTYQHMGLLDSANRYISMACSIDPRVCQESRVTPSK